ncbi:DNA-formamidopyrimidine glycosylase [Niallia endozanthoxylica]|uniref:Formamidopyrimidine-DNA glycosylase n=1 Tax=Niallia endozanthoxylica TaxID=2036016 RepID=A0A5J5I7V2_9BACI|nr:DNA-formamidopyrimidine glycosylase [Niallia endozanthoxylica]KAA9031717.1 DNA-formamidopyrimidine glycosylase [Niallia endozanthoxylica]
MPELPEVETIRRTLLQLIMGKKIQAVSVYWPKIIKQPDEVEQFSDALIGQTIQDIGRRGKFLVFYTDIYALVSHLRMEGRYTLAQSEEAVDKHTHVIFHFIDGTELRYRDVRKFGTMHLFRKGEEFLSLPLSQLGPEPLEDTFDLIEFKNKLASKKRNIKSVLLDQTVLVGLGNIYVDEALFKARIHPERMAQSLSDEETNVLYRSIIETLSEAVKKGGSTVRTYVNSQGEMGMFQLEHNVYGRKGEDCKVCGSELIKTVVGGRGTVFCPSCQN